MTFTVCRTARVAHEVQRVYCESLGDTSQPTWDEAPASQRESAVLGVRFHIEHPEAAPEASDVKDVLFRAVVHALMLGD